MFMKLTKRPSQLFILVLIFTLIFSNFMLPTVTFADETTAINFPDLSTDHWAYPYVQYMVEKGIISGYSDGTFRPNDGFSRSAFAKLLALSFDLPEYSGNALPYSDLPSSHWAYNYIMSAKEYLTAFEKSDGTQVFLPNEIAVREDVAVAMVKAMVDEGLDLSSANLSILDTYEDADEISPNLRAYVALAIEYNVVKGANNRFRPQDPLTRAEASTLFARFLMDIKGTYEDDELIKVPGDSENNYTDDQGNNVIINSGEKAFADNVVNFSVGSGSNTMDNPNEALGEPNYSRDPWAGFVSLGNNGQLTLEFTQVYIVDGPGADIHVFEVGPEVEGTKLEVSTDNVNWIEVGNISGGTASVDLNGYISSTDQISYVRLTDLSNGGTTTPGADIDAVAGINTVTKTASNPTEEKDYTDDQGNIITVNSGVKSFANQVVDFNVGSGSNTMDNPNDALGEPNYSRDPWVGFVSLGNNGQLTLEFTQVYIVDGPGADIHVFEVGPEVEGTKLEVSVDNMNWIEVGNISGGTASVDLNGHIASTDQISYVRLTDLSNGGSITPGADIDAVAGINTILK
jgi:hypothetical protein